MITFTDSLSLGGTSGGVSVVAPTTILSTAGQTEFPATFNIAKVFYNQQLLTSEIDYTGWGTGTITLSSSSFPAGAVEDSELVLSNT